MSRQHTPMDPREGRSRMWQSMRVMRTFTVADMEATAEVSRSSATHYVRALRAAGYINRLPDKRIGNAAQFLRYALVRDTGPLAPRVSHGGSVADMNAESAKRQPTVAVPRAEYDRALRCIRACETLRARGADGYTRDLAAKALEVAR